MALPLYVDLDGTLIRGDTMQQASVMLLRRSPLRLLWACMQLIHGRPAAKRVIAEAIDLDPARLQYRPEVMAYVQNAREQGRRVVLATGTDQKYADAVAAHIGPFDAVYGSHDDINLTAENKLATIRNDGGDAFEYLGDSHADRVIFQNAAVSGWVGSKKLGLTIDGTKIHRMAAETENRPVDLLRLMRPHQWTKNLLVLLPVLTSHRWNDARILGLGMLTLIALSFVASATYIFNDLLDLDADQRHPDKCERPIASGVVTIAGAMKLSAILLIVGLGFASMTNLSTFGLILGYLALSVAYSISLKKRLLVDVITLAALYSIRPVIGGHATGILPSEWLTVFCAFFFASLAFLKRYTELKPHVEAGLIDVLPGRGYQPQDLRIIEVVGPVTGIAAVLVIALYVNSPIVTALYQRPQYLWAWCPLIGYWIVRSWMLANRGTLHHDPVVFAFTDSRSYGVIFLMALTALLAGAR